MVRPLPLRRKNRAAARKKDENPYKTSLEMNDKLKMNANGKWCGYG